nr:hypothetical protein [Sphingomonas populi]
MNLSVECGSCGHQGVVDGPKLWRWFAVHRWNGSIERVGQHLRCSVCKRRPSKLEATQAQPSVEFGPRSEREWQAVVKRLRG